MTTKMLRLDDIRIDGGTQPRAEINQEVVADYQAAYEEMADMPAVDVMFDGVDYWLYDGFHRYHGRRGAGLDSIEATIHKGTQRDAVLASLKANQAHGLRRSNADKRKAVGILLADPEWTKWSDRAIAEAAGVSHTMVSEMREQVATVANSTPRKGKDGKQYPAGRPKAKDGTSATDGAARTQSEVGTATEGDGGTDAPAGPPKPVTDAVGQVIADPAVAAIFADGQLADIARRLRAIRSECKALADKPAGAWLRSQELDIHLDQAESSVRWAMPYAICPAGVKEKKYRAIGWLTKEAYNNLPPKERK